MGPDTFFLFFFGTAALRFNRIAKLLSTRGSLVMTTHCVLSPSLVCLSAAIIFLPTVSAENNSNDRSVDRIIESWQKTQQRIQTALVEWETKQFHPQGSIFTEQELLRAHLTFRGKPLTTAIPINESTFFFASSLFLDGEKIRFETDEHEWSHDLATFVAKKHIGVVNNETCRVYDSPGAVSFGRGCIYPANHAPEMSLISVMPLMLMLRPRDLILGKANELGRDGKIPAEKGITLLPTSVIINGRSCDVLELRDNSKNNPKKIQVCVDRANGFRIMRYMQLIGDADMTTLQITFEFAPSPDKDGMPNSWGVVWTRPDMSIRMTRECKLTKWSINGPANNGKFDLVFPPRTLVYDFEKQTESVISSDGKERVVQKSEYGPNATFDSLAHPKPPQKTSRGSIYYIITVFLCLVFVFIITRRSVIAKSKKNQGGLGR